MFEQHRVKIGVVPVKRQGWSMEDAVAQKERLYGELKTSQHSKVELVTVEDVVDQGILCDPQDLTKTSAHLHSQGVDGLFMPHCDFGTEEVVGRLGKMMDVPFLLWGPRDDAPHPDTGVRSRDTQCGLFASSKVLQRYGVPFSYIPNSPPDAAQFQQGFARFAGVVSVVQSMRNLRIAQISTRPKAFLSVMYNEDELLQTFGIEVVPVSPVTMIDQIKEMVKEQPDRLVQELADIQKRIDCSAMDPESLAKIAAFKLVTKEMIEENHCSCAAIECWSLFRKALGVVPCFVVSELTDMGIPIACETDIHGAVTSMMVQAAALGTTATFFADLTIRHPDNDQAELLWHCGPFPYSLKAADSSARLVNDQAHWRLRGGDVTIARFDAAQGDYSLIAGQGRGVPGPKTTGTYLWVEVDDWERWEERFIFGPYIHHVVGIHGSFAQILLESCKYLPGLKADGLQPVPLSL